LVGIRVPDSEFIRQICVEANKVPLALTSANVRYYNYKLLMLRRKAKTVFSYGISSATSTLCVEEFRSLYPLLSAVFDGGKLGETPEAR
jgi:hypothetical protein